MTSEACQRGHRWDQQTPYTKRKLNRDGIETVCRVCSVCAKDRARRLAELAKQRAREVGGTFRCGHPLTEDNVRIGGTCRMCSLMRTEKLNEARKAATSDERARRPVSKLDAPEPRCSRCCLGGHTAGDRDLCAPRAVDFAGARRVDGTVYT